MTFCFYKKHLLVLGVCDYNPYGLALLLTYKFRSAATILEGADLQAPHLK